MDEVQVASTDRLPLCCMCQQLLTEAVQLKCLHNCCRQCFGATASTAGSEGVSCTACDSVTQIGSEQPNRFLDSRVQRYRLIAESRVCGMCKCTGQYDKPALLWCATCRHSLCGDCIAGHRQHGTQSLEELTSLDEVLMQPSASACAIHGKPLEVACRNCEQPKCMSCWAECDEKKHEMHIVGQGSFDSYVGKFISSIASLESELLRKSEVLQKPKILLLDTNTARDRHLEEIGARKRRVVDAVEMVYQEIEFSTKSVYDEFEAECHAAAAVANRIDADLTDARDYVSRLLDSDEKCEILNQQKIVLERLSALSAELDRFSERLTGTTREVISEVSLPDDMESVVRAWIGKSRVYAASSSPASGPLQLSVQQEQQQQQQAFLPSQQQQIFSFGTALATFNLPVSCMDVALAQDGRSLLLAAKEHGLIELSSASGHELSRWSPSKLSGGRNDSVNTVTALSEGRAAVSLYDAQIVVVLRRYEESSGGGCSSTAEDGPVADVVPAACDDAWTEDCRLQLQLQVSPFWLSAYGDVLAASGDEKLQLLSLSSGRQLSDTVLQRDYIIGSLTVAARVVITGSYWMMELGGGRRAAHVLDAHCLADAKGGGSDQRLWRHVLCSCSDSEQEEEKLQEELLWGVCADSSGGCLYAAVCRSDESSGRLSVLSLADGSELRRVALSFCPAAAAPQPLLLPRLLSLCDDRAAAEQKHQPQQRRSSCCCHGGRQLLLAVLCSDRTTVTLHHSVNDMLQ